MRHLKNRIPCKFLTLIILFTGNYAFSHQGHWGSSFSDGLVHPLAGLDHLLAAVALGVFASQSLDRFNYKLPFLFVGSLFVGALIGYFVTELPRVEDGILILMIALSFLMMITSNLTNKLRAFFVISFGVFHGNAHGYEYNGSPFDFFGYLSAVSMMTAALHLTGVAFALTLKRHFTQIKVERSFQILGVVLFLAVTLLFF